MNRNAYKDLLIWKQSNERKPLLIQGARQVGKTWLIKQFATKEYSNYIRIDFERDKSLESIFKNNLNPKKIIEALSLYLGKKIEVQNTLLFFDEIQAAPRAITSLKYFYEEAPEYHLIAAGSLLGVSVIGEVSFPVGKINFLDLYPMDFSEFLLAMGEDLLHNSLYTEKPNERFTDAIHIKLNEYLRRYMYIGGMPEVCNSWRLEKDIVKVRKLQNDIIQAYQRDFSKYSSPEQAIRTAELWRSIPTQLSKENKKFKYSDVKKRSRAVTWESTIEWLRDAGLILTTINITKPELPLSGYCDRSKFKLYLLDVGLLGAMLQLSSNLILKPEELFAKYNGAFVENFVAQQLSANGEKELYYWTSRSDAEIDFLLKIHEFIIPIEVKSGSNRNLKSLQSYIEKYKPLVHVRHSPRNLKKSENFYNIPLYYNLTACLHDLVQNK